MFRMISKLKVLRCWILYLLCFGKKRQHYKQKYRKLINKNDIFYNQKMALKYVRKHADHSLFVIGDSHSDIFHHNNYEKKTKILGNEIHETQVWFNFFENFICYHMDAVIAYNTMNPKATIPTIKKVQFLIDKGFLPKGCQIICSFGEIDCRVHIQKQSEKQNCPVEKIIDDVLNNYKQFLLMLKERGYKVIAYGPIPSQSDDIPVDNNFPRYGNQIQRNQITKIFNEKLKTICQKENLEYKTLFYDLLNKNMTTKGEYISYMDHVHLGTQSFYMIRKLFCPIDNQKLAKSCIPFNKIPAFVKDVFILTYHSGEVFIFLELLQASKNFNQIKKQSFLIATKKYHIDLIKMLCPEIPYVFYPKSEELIHCDTAKFKYLNKNVHIVFPKYLADSCHPLWLNFNLEVHYFNKIAEYIDMDVDYTKKPCYHFTQEIQQTLLQKINDIQLKEKFIFIAPEALTIQPLPKSFWRKLNDSLEKKGYDVFWNTVKEKFDFGKSFDCSISEANLLASKSKGIVSLRSGLSEQLATIHDIPMIVLYTSTWNYPQYPMISAQRFHEIASLKNYPFTSKQIYEFEAVQADDELVDKIVQLIIKKGN